MCFSGKGCYELAINSQKSCNYVQIQLRNNSQSGQIGIRLFLMGNGIYYLIF